jgi:hypothetical protein
MPAAMSERHNVKMGVEPRMMMSVIERKSSPIKSA